MNIGGNGDDYNGASDSVSGGAEARSPGLRLPAGRKKFNHSLRLIIVAVAFFAWAGIILSRLFYLQLFEADELKQRAERQYQHQIVLNPKRGTIFDSRGRPLALNVDAFSVYAVPEEIENPKSAAEA